MRYLLQHKTNFIINIIYYSSHGDFVTIIDLPEGEHEYKFCVDGVWKHDPKMKLKDSTSGTKHNLITVKGSDFEVFQALANDSENSSGDLQSESTFSSFY